MTVSMWSFYLTFGRYKEKGFDILFPICALYERSPSTGVNLCDCNHLHCGSGQQVLSGTRLWSRGRYTITISQVRAHFCTEMLPEPEQNIDDMYNSLL